MFFSCGVDQNELYNRLPPLKQPQQTTNPNGHTQKPLPHPHAAEHEEEKAPC